MMVTGLQGQTGVEGKWLENLFPEHIQLSKVNSYLTEND